MLKQIIANAERNATAVPQAKRHPEVLKKFATALFIYAGPLAYNLLHKNLHQALPSLRTVQRVVHANYNTMNEGEFRFDGLAAHIAKHDTVSLVSIGEDATRIICRVEYDIRTNRCVGFGLPEVDSFSATSFDAIEKMFTTQSVAKYAYVYMAQPLDLNVPAFCLACFGTNNRFTTDHVLSRWKHIGMECSKRKIQVVSFGGDGDSRIMKAMRVFSKQIQLLPPLQLISCPSNWNEWFWMHRPCSVVYVQDTVHIAVKLKCRVLPMGQYVAGAHHLQIIKKYLSKDVHGLRERDIDHKDKQNFDAVLHIIRALPCLDQLPDAAATKQFILLMQFVTDSYLDKKLDPLKRIENIWYVTFCLRYWRKWILEHPTYTQKFFLLHTYVLN